MPHPQRPTVTWQETPTGDTVTVTISPVGIDPRGKPVPIPPDIDRVLRVVCGAYPDGLARVLVLRADRQVVHRARMLVHQLCVVLDVEPPAPLPTRTPPEGCSARVATLRSLKSGARPHAT